MAERIPIDRAVGIGGAFGRAWFRLGGPRTALVREQLRAAFPDADEGQREVWARGVFDQLGMGLAEWLLLRGRHREALLDRVRIEGLEHVEGILRADPSRGAMIVTGHLGNWELACAKIAASGIPVSLVYRDLDRPILDRLLLETRGSSPIGDRPSEDVGTLESIPMGRAGLRVARALREGRAVLALIDQNARRNEGLFVSFFGRPASTRPGPLVLAARLEVPVLFATMRRAPDRRSHHLSFEKPLDLEVGTIGSDDGEALLRRNLQRVTRRLERAIRAEPSQWIWTHRRWRTRPVSGKRVEGGVEEAG